MKIVKKLTLIISILLPLAVTVFVGFYSYGAIGNWHKLQNAFLNQVFNDTDPAKERIEEYVKFNSSHYYLNINKLNVFETHIVNSFDELEYRNPVESYYFSAKLNDQEGFKLTSYAHGVIDDGRVNQNFFLYDINHQVVNPKNLYLITVYDNSDQGFENLLRAIEQFDSLYVEKNTTSSATSISQLNTDYPLYDPNAILTDEQVTDEVTPFMYAFIPVRDYVLQDEAGNDEYSTTNYEKLGMASFAIIEVVPNDGDPLTRVWLTGNIGGIDSSAEKISKNPDVQLGYGVDMSQALIDAGYIAFVWPKLLWRCLLTLLVTGVICYLFYATWTIEETNSDPKNRNLKLKK